MLEREGKREEFSPLGFQCHCHQLEGSLPMVNQHKFCPRYLLHLLWHTAIYSQTAIKEISSENWENANTNFLKVW